MSDISELLKSIMGDSFNPFEEPPQVIGGAVEEAKVGKDGSIEGRELVGVIGPDGEMLTSDNIPDELKTLLQSMGLLPDSAPVEMPTIKVRFSIIGTEGYGVEEEEIVSAELLESVSFPEALLTAGSEAAARAVIKATNPGMR